MSPETATASSTAVGDHLPELLAAVIDVGRELDLPGVLRRIVEVAVDLVDCRYGALGVIGEEYASAGHGRPGRSLTEFVTTGIDAQLREQIGPLPHGDGILGVLVRRPQVLRLADLTDHPHSVGFPDHHPKMASFLGVPIRIRDEVFGNLYLTEKRDGEFTEADEAVVLALATAAGVAIDKAQTYATVRRAEQWQAAMAAINQKLLAGDDTSDVLAVVASSARTIAQADVGVIAFSDDAGNLVVEVCDGEGFESLIGSPLPIGEPCIQIPLGWHSQGAALCVANVRSGARFDPEVVSQLQSFAGQAVLALELAEVRRDAEKLAIFEDRDRIARDLHDTVIQQLFAAGMRLDTVSRRLTGEPHTVVQQVVDDLDATVREIRSSIYSLQNVGRGELIGLRARVGGVLEQLRAVVGFLPALSVEGPVDALVGEEAANDLVTVLRELLSNTARHANATHVAVYVRIDGDDVVLEVSDDGVGFTVDDPQLRRSGLDNVAQRAALRGGTFSVDSHPGEAGSQWTTHLCWRVPAT